jgi:signal transduction histidine kinase
MKEAIGRRQGRPVGAGAGPRPATAAAPAAAARAVALAVWRSALLTLGSLVLLVGRPDPSSVDVVPWLLAAAGVCLGLLTVRRAPSVAWLAAIGASYVAAAPWFIRARSFRPADGELGVWLVLAVGASLWAVATLWTAARYAARPGRRLDPVALPVAIVFLGWTIVACATSVGVVLAGQRTPDPAFNWIDVATVPVSFFLPILIVVTGLGIGEDVRAARERARDRLAAARVGGVVPAERLWTLAIATGRELLPGQAAVEEAAQQAERARLAGDLHAAVLPTLRRAIAETEAGGDPEALARHLRTVDLELERLMADRWPVVLEALGVVAALEDLAERLEADGAPPIAIDVEGAAERPPAAVERAAWRFAQVALDNAVRHADAAAITVAVRVDARRVRLAVRDDGRGFDSTAAVRAGARGLADSTRRAGEVGASVRVGPGDPSGTTATFDWEARPAG